MFKLTDAWVESDNRRKVFKFRLQIILEVPTLEWKRRVALDHTRVIPSVVELEVWKRARGCCVLCGERDNLHFDHDLPYSKGGTSLSAKDLRLLGARHNLSKNDKIQ
jgi:5-methylcytosine-specific restriction endonuclease McrA